MPKTKRSWRKVKVKKASQQPFPEDGTQDQAPTKLLPPQSKNSILLNVSPEVRLMIFDYLVPRGKTINIRSGLRTYYTSRDFGTLRLVNKQIYAEASRLFYTLNHFVIGNGFFGKSGGVNLHALKRFLACVPAHHISQIRKLKLRLGYSKFVLDKEKYQPLGHPSDLKILARTIHKRFTGVTRLQLCLPAYGELYSAVNRRTIDINGIDWVLVKRDAFFHKKWSRLIGQETWRSFINLLLKHENLEKIDAGFNNEQLRKSLQHLVDKSNRGGQIAIVHKTK